MKLTKKDIHYIDDKLQRAGIRYADIRMEMTDHVASELKQKEGEFHQNFLTYLARHKHELTQAYSQYKKMAFNRAAGFVAKQLKTLWLTIPVVMLLSYAGARYTGIEDVNMVLYMLNALVASLSFYYFFYYRMYKQTVFSMFEKLLIIILLAGMAFRINNFNQDNFYSLAYLSFGTGLLLALMVSGIKLNRYYENRYA